MENYEVCKRPLTDAAFKSSWDVRTYGESIWSEQDGDFTT